MQVPHATTETTKGAIDGFLRLPDVMQATQLGRTTIYRHIRKGQFPPPYDLGGKAVGWKRSEIEHWLNDRTPKRPI